MTLPVPHNRKSKTKQETLVNIKIRPAASSSVETEEGPMKGGVGTKNTSGEHTPAPGPSTRSTVSTAVSIMEEHMFVGRC